MVWKIDKITTKDKKILKAALNENKDLKQMVWK